MENINGGLGFKATLDIDDFKVSAKAMERHIKDFSNSAQQDVDGLEDSIRRMSEKAGQYISYYLIGNGMKNLAMSIIQTRGQFQQLEIAFETMLGSSSKANTLMQQMITTAAKTPFDLMGVAEGAKQLMAYGLSADKVNDTLVRLGNIASGLSIPLNDIVYLYGTTMVQGRLYSQDVRQFTGRGIPLVKELADKYGFTADKINEMVSAGKIGFPEVEEVINKMTNAGGQFYNLMEKQSSSLTGQVANLEDAWDTALNDLGKQSEGVFSTAISGATWVVEHFSKIADILKAVAVGYGSVKAAIILNSLATKGYTGIAVVDNTARAAKLALMKAESVLSGQVRTQQEALTAAENAHFIALESTLTAEQKSNILKQVRIGAIQGLLTAQQQEYLSNIGLTTSSEGYVAAATSVLTADQRLSLSKMDLTAKGAIYRASVMQEAQANTAKNATTLESMRLSVKEAAMSVESAKTKAIAANQRVEAARYEVYWAKQSGNATAVAAAEKRLEAAVDNQAITRKAALTAQTDFFTKKKNLETLASQQSRNASIIDAGAKTAQAAASNILSAATSKLTAGLKTLWATMVANPIGAVLSLVGLLASAFMMIGDSTEEATQTMNKFGDEADKQLSNAQVLLSVIKNTSKNSEAYKKAFEELNALLTENGLQALKAGASIDEIKEAYDRLTEAIKRNATETTYANTLNKVDEEYNSEKDKLAAKIEEELKGAHHYVNLGVAGVSADSEDIQKLAPALINNIRAMIEEAAPKMVEMSPEAQEEAKAKLRDQITKVMTDAGIDIDHAQFITDYDWLNDTFYDVFSGPGGIIDQSIAVAAAHKENKAAADKMAEGMSNAGDKSKDAAKKIELSTLSLEELHAIMEKFDGEKVNCGIDIKMYGFSEWQEFIKEYNKFLGEKQNDLNTIQGVEGEISDIKDKQKLLNLATTEGVRQYKEYQAQIDKLQAKLDKWTGRNRSGGGKNTANDAVRNREAYAQKELDAERRLEESRIAIMKDGFAKRKAELDLQHKQNLAQIDKEEKELAEARKNAGMGALTEEQRQWFATRRNNENTAFTRNANDLVVAEIAEKRKQYELYWRWVANMGKDVADTQFAELLKSGKSYSDYLNREIAVLEAKRDNGGGLSESENNQLFTLNSQRSEINGINSALDAFKASVSQTIAQCSTLAEKIEAVAEAKERLQNGESGIVNDDDRLAASVELAQQEAELQQQVQNTVLTDYRTYEEQKKSIQDYYALLRKEAERQGNVERVELINKGEREALSTLNANMLMQTDSWKNLFTDLDSLTVSEIDKLISNIQTTMRTADLQLNPQDLKAVLDRLDEARAKIMDVNPFKALGKSITEVFKQQADGSKKSSSQIKTEWKNVGEATKGCFDFVSNAVDSCDVLGDLLGETGKQSIQMLSGIATAGIAMAAAIKTAETGSVVLLAISVALQAIQWIATLFNNDKNYEKRIESIQKSVDELERGCERLKRAFDETYWVFSDEEREGFEKNNQLIKDQIAALEKQRQAASLVWDFAAYAQLTAQINALNKQLAKAQEEGDMLSLVEAQKANLRQQQALIREQIALERKNKDVDEDKITQWENAIEDIDTQIEDIEKNMLEVFAGTTTKEAIDQFADAIVSAYCSGEDAAKALGDTTREVLKKAVIDALKRQFLAKAMDDAVKYLATSMSDGKLTDAEKKEFERMTEAAGETFRNALEAVGDWIKDVEETETDPLTGAVKGMSEETAGVIAGRFNAFIVNQADQTSVLREQLLTQSQIAQSIATSNNILQRIDATLKRIETKDNSLLSQGIS